MTALGELNQLSVMRAHARLAAHFQARVHEDISALESSTRRSEDALDYHRSVESTAVEVGALLHLTRRAAEATTDLAIQLVRRLPEVHRAMLRGDLDVPRARALYQGTDHLPPHTARRIVNAMIDEATELTTGQLAARLRKLCLEHDPEDAARRYEKSVEDRRIEFQPAPEGTTHLFGLNLPADRMARISRHLDMTARELRRLKDGRTMDQLRADAMLDILEGAHQHNGKRCGGGVHLEVDLATLAGLNDDAGEIPGFGPITADLARQLADEMKDAEWIFVITDPETGDVVCDGKTRRRPLVSQRRRIRSRHKRCVWPGCRMPSVDCDTDHRIRHVDGGCGHDHNFAPVCRFHHRMRHQAGWIYRRLKNGDIEWTSRSGRTYLVRRRPRGP